MYAPPRRACSCCSWGNEEAWMRPVPFPTSMRTSTARHKEDYHPCPCPLVIFLNTINNLVQNIDRLTRPPA